MYCPWCEHLRCDQCEKKETPFPELWLKCCTCGSGAISRKCVQPPKAMSAWRIGKRTNASNIFKKALELWIAVEGPPRLWTDHRPSDAYETLDPLLCRKSEILSDYRYGTDSEGVFMDVMILSLIVLAAVIVMVWDLYVSWYCTIASSTSS